MRTKFAAGFNMNDFAVKICVSPVIGHGVMLTKTEYGNEHGSDMRRDCALGVQCPAAEFQRPVRGGSLQPCPFHVPLK